MEKERLDVLVQRRFDVTRSKAQGLIQTGQVCGPDGTVLDKPGARVAADLELSLREPPRFVSRGGDKLEAAFAAFSPEVAGTVAIDVARRPAGLRTAFCSMARRRCTRWMWVTASLPGNCGRTRAWS